MRVIAPILLFGFLLTGCLYRKAESMPFTISRGEKFVAVLVDEHGAIVVDTPIQLKVGKRLIDESKSDVNGKVIFSAPPGQYQIKAVDPYWCSPKVEAKEGGPTYIRLTPCNDPPHKVE